MVRFLVLYNKPSDIEGFERHYREVHIPLTKKFPGLRRYTLSRQMTPIRGGQPFYLVAELDWDDMDLLKQASPPRRVRRQRATWPISLNGARTFAA